jgi:iron complex outermembrane receptor protein
VNIVTREPEPGAHAGVQAAVGSFGYVAPSITASYADPRWNVSGGYSQRQADPYEDGNGTPFTELEGGNYKPEASDEQAFHVDTMWAGGAVTLGRSHRLKLRMTRQEGDTQLYPYLLMDANYDNASRVAATYDAQGPFGWIETVEASASYASVDHDMTDALRISSNGMPLPYSMATLADSAVLGESLRFVLHGGFAVGAEAYQRNWDATTRLAGPKKDYKPQSSIPDVDTRAAGLFATWETALSPAWKLRAGARADRIATQADSSLANVDLYYAYHGTRSTSRSDFLPAANVSATWAVSRAWELFAGLGRTARSPDPSERYFALKRMGSDWVGDPDLAPSKNTELDLGARLKAAAFSLDANVYHAWLADYIVVVNAARQNTVPGVMNTSARSYANDDARMWGGEATARWLVGGRIALAAGISYVRGVQDLNAALGIHDPDLPEMAPLTGRVSARYDTGKRFVEVEGVASAQQDRVNTDLNERRTPGWGIVNLRGGMELNRFSVYAGVGNLFDRFYRENYSYQRDPFRSGVEVPEPGRTISVSMQLRY